MTPPVTSRLILRSFTLDDAPFILRLLNEPSFIDNIADKGVRTLEQAKDYLSQGPMASYTAHGHGLWMVQHRESGTPMGMCGLIKRDTLPEVDLGYALVPEFWGQGHAREAATACLHWGRDSLGLSGVMAIVSPGNAASIRLLESLGFLRTGRMLYAPDDEVEVYRIDLG
jgi:RimJ/RimL family protein N-acetyltransferase